MSTLLTPPDIEPVQPQPPHKHQPLPFRLSTLQAQFCAQLKSGGELAYRRGALLVSFLMSSAYMPSYMHVKTRHVGRPHVSVQPLAAAAAFPDHEVRPDGTGPAYRQPGVAPMS